MAGWHMPTDSTDMSLSKLQEVVKDRDVWCAKSQTWLSDWTTRIFFLQVAGLLFLFLLLFASSEWDGSSDFCHYPLDSGFSCCCDDQKLPWILTKVSRFALCLSLPHEHQDLLPTCLSIVIVVQLLSPAQLFGTLRTAACQAALSFTISWSLLRFMFIELVIPSNHLILCHPLLLLPSVFLSIRVFPMSHLFMDLHTRCPKY